MLETEPVHLPSRSGHRRAFWALLIIALAGVEWLLLEIGYERVAGTTALGSIASTILVVDMLTPVRMHEGTPQVAVARVVAVILALAGLVSFAAALAGEPWRIALAQGAGVATYLACYYRLTRWQRRGVMPYLRPAWYGFLIAGACGGIVAAAAAQEPTDRLIISGVIWSLLHYGWVRWATRDSAAAAA